MDFLNLEIKERETPAPGSNNDFSIPMPPQPPQFKSMMNNRAGGFPAVGQRVNRKWGGNQRGSAGTSSGSPDIKRRSAATKQQDIDFQSEGEFDSGPWSSSNKESEAGEKSPVTPVSATTPVSNKPTTTMESRLNDTFQPENDAERIHLENLRKLSQMSAEEIMREKEDIMNSFNPQILAALLKRSEIKSGDDASLEIPGAPAKEKLPTTIPSVAASAAKPVAPTLNVYGGERVLQRGQKVMVGDDADSDSSDSEAENENNNKDKNEDHYKMRPDPEADYRAPDWSTIEKLGLDKPANGAGRVHFPVPGQHNHNHNHNHNGPNRNTKLNVFDQGNLENVDSPAFFDDLHQTYYANLPREPEKLAWMKPTTDAERQARDADMISQMSMLPSEIRFDFRGNILGPKTGEQVPSHLGLHHHGDQPDLAGYTVLELAHLARSTVPGQRCIAIQTLGRILFRLGDQTKDKRAKTTTTTEDGDANQYGYGREISLGIRGLVEQCRVIDTLMEASGDKERHLGVKNYAVEALWLWKQGGGDKTRAAV